VFTGLIAELGELAQITETELGARLGVRSALARELAAGDSIAVNGVCLTASALASDGGAFEADVMRETLARTALGALRAGTLVNLELPLRPADRLGGHVVQGHVDAVGEIRARREDGFARVLEVAADPDVLRYVAAKGSIAVDGVSLTVVDVDDGAFSVSLIPETLERTTLGAAGPGTRVNLEVDVIAKYVERLVGARAEVAR
jgi:riboflavin synthase